MERGNVPSDGDCGFPATAVFVQVFSKFKDLKGFSTI